MGTSKGAGRTSRRTAWISALLVGLVIVTFAVAPASAGKIHGELRGVVDVPGSSLTLPLAAGASNVTITLFLGGVGGPPLPITITASTKVEAEDAKDKVSGSVTVGDGDLIVVHGKLQSGAIVATKIELEKFPEIEAFGIVKVPGSSLTLPLVAGASNVTITLAFGGVGGPPLPIIVTPSTRVGGGMTLTLKDNDFIEVKAVLQSGQIVAVKIGEENESEVEDE